MASCSSRRIVARVLGDRSRATAERLWAALPAEYRTATWYYRDEWEAYRGVFPAPAHRPSPKGSGQTSLVEALNCFVAPTVRGAGVQILLVQPL